MKDEKEKIHPKGQASMRLCCGGAASTGVDLLSSRRSETLTSIPLVDKGGNLRIGLQIFRGHGEGIDGKQSFSKTAMACKSGNSLCWLVTRRDVNWSHVRLASPLCSRPKNASLARDHKLGR